MRRVLRIASVSGNSIYRSCFRIFSVSSDISSASVHGRLWLSAAIVTQLVTRIVGSACSRCA